MLKLFAAISGSLILILIINLYKKIFRRETDYYIDSQRTDIQAYEQSFVPSTRYKLASIDFYGALSFVLVMWLLVFTLAPGTDIYITFVKSIQLHILSVDSFSKLFALVVITAFALALLYGGRLQRPAEVVAALFYVVSAVICIFAGDWLTLIFFWEMMAISSTVLVWLGGSRRSLRAGISYLIYHFLGGNFLLFGIVLTMLDSGLEIAVLTGDYSWGSILIFMGIIINAAIFPLHTWLSDAYPETSRSGIVFMNILTTKVAVFMLVKVFPGEQLLLYFGIAAAFWGVLYAMQENNARRLLSYHIISQVGLMAVAISIGSELSLNAAIALAIGNIVFKSLLFMSCGEIIRITGKYQISEWGAVYKQLPLLAGLFMLGALAIAGTPLLLGYPAKQLLSAAVYSLDNQAYLWTIYVASAGTALSIPLKMGYYGLYAVNSKDANQQKLEYQPIQKSSILAMSVLALACLVFGVFPNLLYSLLPYVVQGQTAYALDEVWLELLYLAIIAAIFFSFKKLLQPKIGITLDIDWFWYKVLIPTLLIVGKHLQLASLFISEAVDRGQNWFFSYIEYYDPDRTRVNLGWIIVPSLLLFVISAIIVMLVNL